MPVDNSKILKNSVDSSMYRYPYENRELVDMEGEIWKDLYGYESYLMVSNYGRIKSKEKEVVKVFKKATYVYNRPEFIYKQKVAVVKNKENDRIYRALSITVVIEGKRYSTSVARAVYSTFVCPLKTYKENPLVISHYDDDKLNNHVDNLFLNSQKEVSRRSIQLGKMIPSKISEEGIRRSVEKNSIPVSQYDLEGKYIQSFESISQASRCTGIDKKTISEACSGKIRLARGSIWKKGNSKTQLSQDILKKHHTFVLSKGQKAVNQYDLEGNLIRRFSSMSDAMRESGISISAISNACKSKSHTARGYLWKLAEENIEEK